MIYNTNKIRGDSMKKKFKKPSLRMKTIIVLVLIVYLVASISIVISYNIYANTMDKHYKNLASNIASTAASLMDAEAIEHYYDTLQADDAYYGMLNSLYKIKKNNDLEYLYIQKIVPGENGEEDKTVYIMDADEVDSDRCSEASHLGDEYPLSEGVNAEDLENGIPAFISETEEYGWLASVGKPIIDKDGNVVALVGVDISMNDVMQDRHDFLLIVCLAVILATLAAIVVSIIVITKAIVSPINKLAKATSSFITDKSDDSKKNSAISKLNIHTGDEIQMLSESIKTMEKDINNYITNLTSMTAEKERISTELNVATQIQEDMLPRIFPAFPSRGEFDIHATMNPAKEVGGDFYDFFLIDDDHLAMVIADVSGKGVPAALFMVIAKTLIKNHAQTGASPAKAFERTNAQLCEGNEAGLFVTAWMGVLEISTGNLKYVNAGHNPPLIKRDGKYEYLKGRHGFILAGMEDMHYRESSIDLAPGDVLFLYTDGVTEATNLDNELYGEDRLKNILNCQSASSSSELLKAVKQDVDLFVGEADQFDDITMLGLCYIGNDGKSANHTFTVSQENTPEVLAFTEKFLRDSGCPDGVISQFCIAADEIYSNIAKYSGATTAELYCLMKGKTVTMIFFDDGTPYNPLNNPDPDVTLSAEERKIGGLGIYTVKKMMDSVTYLFDNNKNILTLTKSI